MNTNNKPERNLAPLPSYPLEIGIALSMLEETRQRTKQAIKSIIQEVIDWPPPYERNSVGTLLYHIPAIEASWLYIDVLSKPFPDEIEALFPKPARDRAGFLTAIEEISIADHLNRMDTVRRHLLEEFKGMSVEEYRRPRQGQDVICTPEWVLMHLMQHEAEHRGHIQEVRVSAEAKLKIREVTYALSSSDSSPFNNRVF